MLKKLAGIIISVFALSMMISYVPSVKAAEIVHSGKSGDLDWSIDSEGCLRITGKGNYAFDSRDYTDCPAWCDWKDEIRSSIVNVSGITSTSSMFYWCDNLQSLDISGLDTSQVTNMRRMFYWCSSLPSLDVSGLDTSQVTDMGWMFNACRSLPSIDVSSLDTSQVTDMSHMFGGCSSLPSLDVSGLDTSQVTNMGGMFNGCSSLPSLDVSGLDTSQVTDMGSMFHGCSSLPSLDVSGLDTSQVTNMNYMFRECSSLQSLDVSNFDTSQVTKMLSMFYGCSSLQNIDVSNFDTSQVTNMGSMFYGCSSLQNIDVSNFDTSQVTNMGSMFHGCSSLPSLDVSNFDTSRVTGMGEMFWECGSLQSINLSGFDTSQVTDMRGMFNACRSLPSIDVSSLETSQVTDMGRMFCGCSSLQSINLSGLETSQVTDMAGMFNACRSLPSIDVSSLETSQVTDMSSMFYECSSLQSLDVSNFDTSQVRYMKYMFAGCYNLQTIKTPQKTGSETCDLPSCKDNEAWTENSDNIYTTLPINMNHSIVLMRKVSAGGTIGLNLEWGKDNFSFINDDDSFGTIVGKRYVIEKSFIDNSNFSISDKFAMDSHLDRWGGSCFGMSTATLQIYMGNLKLNQLQESIDKAYDLDKPAINPMIKNYIGLYQATCSTSKYQNARQEFLDKSNHDKLSVLISKLKNIEKTGIPLLIDYAWVDDPSKAISAKDGGWGAHAVLAYALETEGAPYQYNGKNYAYRVRILNPNTLYTSDMDMEEANNDCMYITKDLDDFIIPNGGIRGDNQTSYSLRQINGDGDEYGETNIQFVSDDLSILPATESDPQLIYDSIVIPASVAQINNNVINGMNGGGNGIIGQALIPAGNSNMLNVYIDDQCYDVEFLEDNQAITYMTGNSYQNAVASKGSMITVGGKNNQMKLNNNGGNFKITYASNDPLPQIKGNSFTIEGNGFKTLEVLVQNTKVSILGDDLKGSIITTEDGGKYKVVSDKDEIEISENSKDIATDTPSETKPGGEIKPSNGVSNKNESVKIKVSQITLSGISKRIAAGKKIKLTANIAPSNATNKAVTWKSSNTKLATVSQSGVVTMKKKSGGKSVTITATAMDGSGRKATYKIKSMKGVVKKVSISGKKSVKAGKSLKLKAKVKATKKANTKLKWTSSNPKYAKVSSSGKVKTYKAGRGKSVKITAMATDGSGKKKAVKIKIK